MPPAAGGIMPPDPWTGGREEENLVKGDRGEFSPRR